MGDPALQDDSGDELEKYLSSRRALDTSSAAKPDDEETQLGSYLKSRREKLSSREPPSFINFRAPEDKSTLEVTSNAPDEDILTKFLRSGREGLDDAATAIKPYVRGLGGMAPDPNTLKPELAASHAAELRSPIAAGGARALLDVPAGGLELGPATTGALLGGVYGEQEGGHKDALLRAFLGGGVGALAHGVGAGIEATGNAAPGLEAAASRQRVAATGMYGGQMKKLANEIGPEGITKLGNDIEAKGLHDAPGMAGWFPGSAGRYLDNANTLADDALARQRTTAFDATQRGVAVPTARIANELDAQAGKAAVQFDPAGASDAAFSRDMADRIRGNSSFTAQNDPQTGLPTVGDHQLPFDQALDRRQYLDKNIKWGARNPGAQMPYQEEARRYAANQLRGGLSDALDQQAPELAEPWRNAQSDLNTALTVQTPAAARVYQESGNQAVSLPTWIAGAGGIASGNPVAGAAMGGLASQVKARGHSAMAGALRGAQGVAEGMQDPQIDMLSKFLQSPGAGVAAGGMAAAPQMTPPSRDQVMQDSRGYELPNVINQLLQDPQRAQLLGKYRAQFEQAGRTPGGIQGLLNKLSNNGKDREWQAVLTQLQQMTGESQ